MPLALSVRCCRERFSKPIYGLLLSNDKIYDVDATELPYAVSDYSLPFLPASSFTQAQEKRRLSVVMKIMNSDYAKQWL